VNIEADEVPQAVDGVEVRRGRDIVKKSRQQDAGGPS
jgi:hypothetical protein